MLLLIQSTLSQVTTLSVRQSDRLQEKNEQISPMLDLKLG